MGTIANAKVTHYYNCYNGDFIGCLHINKGHIMLQVQDIYLAPATLHKQKHLLIFNRPASHCQPKAYFRESR